jgi:hypothetical protein
MSKFRRGVSFAALAAGALAAGLLPASVAIAAAPTITISATSAIKPVTGDVFVVFQGGSIAKATIRGAVTGAAKGEVARLYSQQFPFKAAPARIGSLTLSVATQSYSFTVTPTLATHYWVELFANAAATKPIATSVTRVVYVSSGGGVKGGATCGRPVCHEQIVIDLLMPASALTYEMSKHMYPYFGLTLGTKNVPPPPKVLNLGGGKASVTTWKRISAGDLQAKISYSFTIGNHSYYWLWAACTKDSVTRDGLGLPGSHGCGVKQISPNVAYLG